MCVFMEGSTHVVAMETLVLSSLSPSHLRSRSPSNYGSVSSDLWLQRGHQCDVLVQATANTDEARLTMVWIDPQVDNTSRI